MVSRDEANSGRNILFFKGLFDRQYSLIWIYFRLFDFDETAFDRSASLLPWFQTWIGVNNIETLTPEGSFEGGRFIKEEKKNDYGIWMPYHSKGTF